MARWIDDEPDEHLTRCRACGAWVDGDVCDRTCAEALAAEAAQAAHAADDPHCTCPDCLADHERRLDEGRAEAEADARADADRGDDRIDFTEPWA